MNQDELNKKQRQCIRILLPVSIVGTAVLIAVVFLPSHWWQIVLGVIAFIVGSAGLLLTEEWKKRKSLKWVRVIFLPIILAVGGFLTTCGWNTRDNHLHDRALLIAMGSELHINKTYIHVLSERRKDYLSKNDHFSSPIYALPTVQEARQALTRVTSIRDNGPLIHALTVYVMAVDKLVPSYEHIDRICSQPIATMEIKKAVVERFLGNGKDSHLQYFLKAHKQLENALNSSYPWLLKEAKTRIGEDFLDAVEGTQIIVPINPNKTG